ncbi:type I restriction-modification system subunit M [Achromobacter xylosoxidans]|uniref:type I restriction-modification system subunit M n=1 Tax=Alcaligenes xylosoxydans xylosoxydans TaxID=85698 RepID=UPI0003D59ADE|nr:class I SAM-dependent DNA methyltransferase [Achromobacter xylosoxidans]AHC49779.1 Type I restriction-modification system, DNA-methyltransferase subunit M [Achromobacter xylosoxidans NBRC 15126 = ATCC 27061]QKQ54010.1 SAM-dependent DNA methyltransferase [Achromobacter xylosoxidans]QPR96844.1 SAM-dependent DNA methyltransferase [Achromobacter xylosoxidans]UON40786.1 SAM-dependent DNA methyltransferase [Achromobacter xylosoxidans]CKI14405.1 Probable type I restriction enzyme BthVORF4518P M pr
MLQNNPELKSKIDQLWNKFWSGGISNPLTAIEQITYLLFMKRLDELDQKRQADAEWTGEKYTSKFEGTWIPPEERNWPVAEQRPIDKRSLRWSEFKRMQAEEMLQHVQGKVFPFLKDLNGAESNFTHHMKNAVFIIPKPALLVEAVKTIDEIFEVMEKDSRENGQAFQDIQGDVYEMLLAEIATAGKNGQFRTPRHIIKLMAELVQPQLGHKIADPACGTGGFLLGAYQYIVTQLAIKAGTKNLEPDEDGFFRTSIAAALTEKAQAILQESLYGYDIDATMVRLGLMNLMMHGIDEPHIDYQDTLSKSYNEEAEYDIVLANPPFTGSIDKGDINENLQLSTTKTELLFVENIYRLLKKGGTACVIVPQGVLFGSGGAFKTLRQMLVERCDLKAVITLPSGVFKPYAGVSTAILLFTKVWGPKDKVSKAATEHVWFYEMAADGYSLDDKRSKQDGHGDLQDIIGRYYARDAATDTDRTAKCFMVPRSEIADERNNYDLSLSRYKTDVFEDVHYDAPGVILDRLIQAEVGDVDEAELAKVQSGIVRELLELKGMVG